MLLNAITLLVAFLVAGTPFLWPHTGAQTVATLASAAVAAACAGLSCLDRRYRNGVAVAGGFLALSAFAFTSDIVVVAIHLSVGYFFFAAGIAPKVVRIAAAQEARPADAEPEEVRRAA